MATTPSNRGRIVWYELMTNHPSDAMAFYSKVIGWSTQPFGEATGEDAYTMWVGGQGPLGGVMRLPAQAAQMGAPPHWMSHVVVPDVDAALARVRELGGQVLHGPEEVPTVGRFASVRDPQGAHLSLFRPAGEMKPHDPEQAGEFCWNELTTTDHRAAFSFYREICGWEQLGSHDMGPMGEYLLFGANGVMLGGMWTKGPGMSMPSSWMYYIEVKDLDGTIERARAAGAKVINGPMEVPGGARIVQLTDPQGAFFALHEQARK